MIDQLGETVGQQVPGDAQISMEMIETPYASKRVAQDQDRPPITDDLQRAGNRARQLVIGSRSKLPFLHLRCRMQRVQSFG